jgi:purine-binding chemotaxis protein CheW
MSWISYLTLATDGIWALEEGISVEKDSEQLTLREPDDAENVYLSFDVQDERYATNSVYVTEIVELQKISRVLDVPDFVEGTITLRGRVIPVVDSRARLGLPRREQGAWPTIIVLEADGVPAGLMVDRVAGIVSAPQQHIAPSLRRQEMSRCNEDERPSAVRISAIRKVGAGEENVGIVLDVPRRLYTQGVRLEISQQVLVAAEEAAVGEQEPGQFVGGHQNFSTCAIKQT